MISRAIVTDAVTGRFLRVITAPPEMLALNVRAGEVMFIVTNDDGLSIQDGHLIVSEAGEIVPSESAPEGLTAPGYDLQYIPA